MSHKIISSANKQILILQEIMDYDTYVMQWRS